MKVPDKIYVQHAKSMSNGFVGIAWTDKKFNGEPVEYIRKETLMEFIKEEANFWDDGEMIFRELTDKINAL